MPAVIDPALFRRTLGQYATGVTVVTAYDTHGDPWGMTINSFTSLSLDPALILFCLGRRARMHDLLVHGPRFAVNILSADQAELGRRFAQPQPCDFAGVAFGPREGAPVLGGGLGWIVCAPHAVYDGGDHSIIAGAVMALDVTAADAPPLLYHRGNFFTG